MYNNCSGSLFSPWQLPISLYIQFLYAVFAPPEVPTCLHLLWTKLTSLGLIPDFWIIWVWSDDFCPSQFYFIFLLYINEKVSLAFLAIEIYKVIKLRCLSSSMNSCFPRKTHPLAPTHILGFPGHYLGGCWIKMPLKWLDLTCDSDHLKNKNIISSYQPTSSWACLERYQNLLHVYQRDHE